MSASSGWDSVDPPVSPQKGTRVRDRLELSPTSRAKCQRCGEKIMKGVERVGIQAKIDVENLNFRPWQLKYYHADCVSGGTKRKLFLEDSVTATGNVVPAKKETKAPKKTAKTKPSNHGKLTPKMRLELERDLREVRRCFAEQQGCEEYKVFQNQCLQELVANCPQNQAELLKCWGIGKERAAQYGSTILATIRPYLTGGKAKSRRAPQNTSSTAASAPSAAAQTPVDDDDILMGPTLSVEELVRKRMEEVRARGEEFEILD
eukprot:CAMPEP_0185817334 /NCGR_PEP_ID=MMETSP1322-20130828/18933_1 /TAXON_ID=265543 /ORGANISM="Minutocellus polymorphus, Strain RCC2270" /LENGTH=261 /DNA_ID=CAMNT_0028514363 /DNA_START=32 /DNA_END=817 /DNA_ORIENTATION=+